jgi:hypothetical protein
MEKPLIEIMTDEMDVARREVREELQSSGYSSFVSDEQIDRIVWKALNAVDKLREAKGRYKGLEKK